MPHSELFENLTQSINQTLIARTKKTEDFLTNLQEEIFAKIKTATLIAVGTAPTGAKSLIIGFSRFNIVKLNDKENPGLSNVSVTCTTYFSDNDITSKDNVVLGKEKTYDVQLFNRNVTMYNHISNTHTAIPEDIEYFRFYQEDFHADVTFKELFPDGSVWEIPLKIS